MCLHVGSSFASRQTWKVQSSDRRQANTAGCAYAPMFATILLFFYSSSQWMVKHIDVISPSCLPAADRVIGSPLETADEGGAVRLLLWKVESDKCFTFVTVNVTKEHLLKMI